MARKQQTRSTAAAKRKRSIARIVFYILSLLIVLSMAIGFVIDALVVPSYYETVTPVPIVSPQP
ncbi:MAG: hypothetical protein ACP5R2_00340 [Anaerolineae bacterium]